MAMDYSAATARGRGARFGQRERSDVDGNDNKPGAEHFPAGPYADVEIKGGVEHPQRRNMKRKADADRLAGESEKRHGDAHGKQRERRQFTAALPPGNDAVGHEPQKQAGNEGRHGDVGLGLLEIVDEGEQRDCIHRLMQAPPAQTAKPAHHAVGRGRGKRRQSEPGRAADNEIPAMRDLVHDLAGVVALIGDEERKVRGNVAERADAEHAPDVDEIAVAHDAAEWRHRKRQPEKHQGPEAGAVDEIVDWPGAVDDGRGVE